jgi:hypothetical protein
MTEAALVIRNPVELSGPKSDGGRYKLPKSVGPQLLRRVIPWVEDYWHSRGRYPSDSEFLTRYEITPAYLSDIHSSRLYREALRSRGITRELEVLSPEQIATITVLSNFADGRSQDAKLAGLGVSVEQFNGWLRQEEFVKRLHHNADEMLDKIYPEAMSAFARKIKQGDMRAIDRYLEITGRAMTPETLDAKRLVQLTIEAVQRHVKDPETLQKIAADIQIHQSIS